MTNFLDRITDAAKQLGSWTPLKAEPSTPAPALVVGPVLAPAHQLVLMNSEKQQISDFKAELAAALSDINEACKQSQETRKKISELNSELQDRGWWGAVKATLDSSTDKELSTQLLALSKSMSLTQQIVRVMLKVQTQKNQLLHAFNDALVTKIADIEKDTCTLDSNQRNAALAFLGELQQQIEDQLRQIELVEYHEQRIQEHAQKLFELANSHAESAQQLTQVEATLRQHIDEISHWRLDKDGRDTVSAQQLAQLAMTSSALQQKIAEIGQWQLGKDKYEAALRQQLIQSESKALTLKKQVLELAGRLVQLEASQLRAQSMKTMLIRQILPLIALGLAAAALWSQLATV